MQLILPAVLLLGPMLLLIFLIINRGKQYEYFASVTIPCIEGDLENELKDNVYNILLLKESVVFLGNQDKKKLEIKLSDINDTRIIYDSYVHQNINLNKASKPEYLMINYHNSEGNKKLIFDATTAKTESEYLAGKISSRKH